MQEFFNYFNYEFWLKAAIICGVIYGGIMRKEYFSLEADKPFKVVFKSNIYYLGCFILYFLGFVIVNVNVNSNSISFAGKSNESNLIHTAFMCLSLYLVHKASWHITVFMSGLIAWMCKYRARRNHA